NIYKNINLYKIMKKSGKKGTKAELSIKTDEFFTMDDLTYAFSYHQKIEDLYNKLRSLWSRAKSNDNYKSYTDWAKEHKIDTRLMPIMKAYGYCDENSK